MKNTLESFLEFHTRQMLHCFVTEHFEVMLKPVKKLVAIMDILVDYEYLDAVVRYGPSVRLMWEHKQQEYILQCLAHELTHILTGHIIDGLRPTRKLIKRTEQTTEHISRLLYRLYRGGL